MNSKAQKIIMIIAISLASIVALSFVFLALFKKDYNPKLDDPTRLIVYASTDTPKSYGQDSQTYKDIMRLYNDSFRTSFLDAMLQGKVSTNPKLVAASYKNLSSLQSSSNTYLEFFYNEPIKITDPAMKYTDKYYVSVVAEVLNSESLTQINIYFRYGESGTANYSYVRYVTLASQSGLYSYMHDLVK